MSSGPDGSFRPAGRADSLRGDEFSRLAYRENFVRFANAFGKVALSTLAAYVAASPAATPPPPWLRALVGGRGELFRSVVVGNAFPHEFFQAN